MGFGLSSYDKESRNTNMGMRKKHSYDYNNKVDPNPDPKNFKIISTYESPFHLLVEIRYPNCTNYEGRKILLYEGVSKEKLSNMKEIDPHFDENCISPIARFQPTKYGWNLGKSFVDIEYGRKLEEEREKENGYEC